MTPEVREAMTPEAQERRTTPRPGRIGDRVVTAGGALLALAAVVAFAVAERTTPISRPTADQNGTNGYLALSRWLGQSGVRAESFRYSALELGEREPGPGHLLVSAMPHVQPLRTGEADALRSWVADGNTLLLSVALDDTPAWAREGRPFKDLEALTGLRFDALDGIEIIPRFGPEAIALRPVDRRDAVAGPVAGAVAGVAALQGETDARTSIWRLAPGKGAEWQPLARTQRYRTDAIWHSRLGQGHMYLVALGSLLTNRAIGLVDNARFFANVANAHVGAGGAVIFDDFHQGLSARYDPDAFFRDPRLHISALVLLALWLLYLVGTWNRLAPPATAAAAPGQTDFVYAVGGMLARKLHRADAARLLFAARFGRLAGRRATLEEPPWRQLADMPAIPAALATALREDYRRAEQGRCLNLLRLRNRLLATTPLALGRGTSGEDGARKP